MKYCMFRNTLGDLKDCHDYMDEYLSEEETLARKAMIKICKIIVDEYGDELLEDE